MGSAKSGDELVAGERNGANHTTTIVADRRAPGEEVGEFTGNTILLATPPYPYGNPPNTPLNTMDGITGVATKGGAGVRGLGGTPEGPYGAHGGDAQGGDGVIGHGGSGDFARKEQEDKRPGIGVLGIGGFWAGPQQGKDIPPNEIKGGPGVVGVAAGGNFSPSVPSFDQAQGVGVYGGSAVGVGVVGDGVGHGVEAFSRQEFGVFARGLMGGVYGRGAQGPGGTFAVEPQERKAPIAQLRMVSQPMWVPPEDSVTQVLAIRPAETDGLPRKGAAGELLVTHRIPKQGEIEKEKSDPATLWFCETTGGQSDGDPPAIWRQVLLGARIRGKK